MRRFAWAVVGGILSGCAASQPPPNWARGGAAIDIPQAHWERGGSPVDILPDGRVLVDDEHWFTLDRAGRIFEPDNEPIAILAPDGQVLGKNGVSVGSVGVRNAALPGGKNAWISLSEQGEVIRYDADGEPHRYGIWTGCGAALRTCTAVTHLVSLLEAQRRPHVGVGVGFGLMFGR